MEEDDWDTAAPPLSRSDRIQRITSPENTLPRPQPGHHPPYASGQPATMMHVGSSNSLARAAQQQQLHLAAALMHQQQLQQQLAPQNVRGGSLHHLDILLDHHQQPPGHVATLRRQAQLLALQAAHTNSLPRPAPPRQQIHNIPASPTVSQRQRHKHSTSLPPTTGQQLRPAGPGALSPDMNSARRLSNRLELHLDPQGLKHLDSLPRRAGVHSAMPGQYWGQHDVIAGGNKNLYDPYSAAQQQAIYSGDGSTSSYARINRQTYPSAQVPSLQTAEPAYIHQHDENTSLTSQKTSRTQASMLTKSAPTPSGSGSGSGASGSTPQQKQSETTGSTTISASAKYAEYISNLEKYQHPPPSKRHVTFIKYRGRQCTIGMLVIFALLVIGLVVAPVVYFTAFANKAQTADSTSQARLTTFINGQITLDTTHGSYADLMTDPGRPPDDGLKRVQRDMEDLLKDVLHGPGGFAADEVNSVMVSQPQRPDTHQIFLRFQVLLKNPTPLEAAESKTSKAFASATKTDAVGTQLKDVPIVANSLFYRAVPQTNTSNTLNAADTVLIDGPISSSGNKLSDLVQLDSAAVNNGFNIPIGRTTTSALPLPYSTVRTSVNAVLTNTTTPYAPQTPTRTVPFTPPPPVNSPPSTLSTTPTSTVTTRKTSIIKTTSPNPEINSSDDESFRVGGGSRPKKLTTVSDMSTFGSPWSPLPDVQPTFGFTLPTANNRDNAATKLVEVPPAFVSPNSQSSRPSSGTFSSQKQSEFTPQQQFGVTTMNRAPEMDTSRGFTSPQNFGPVNGNTNSASTWENRFFHTSPIPKPPYGVSPQEGQHFSGPQFVQVFDANLPTSRGQSNNPQFLPENFHNQPQSNPVFQPRPDFSNPQFGRQPGAAFEGGPFRAPPPQNPPSFGAPQSFPLNRFAADDAHVPAASLSSTILITTTKATAKSRTSADATSTMQSTVDETTAADRSTELPTRLFTVAATQMTTMSTEEATTVGTEETVLLPEKREFSGEAAAANLPANDGQKRPENLGEKDATDLAKFFSSTAPLLVSDWGNWSDWGNCSAPVCNSEGFQMRTRSCLTSINGATPGPDHDASCTVNGGQGIEARPCVCEVLMAEETSTPFMEATEPLESAPETTSVDYTFSVPELSPATFPDPAPATFPDLPPATFPDPPVTAVNTEGRTIVGWSMWTDWSHCSIEPCHSHGIQTRHRTCKTENGNGVQVSDNACFNLEGTSVDTRPCDCPIMSTSSTVEQEESATTPTFVRPSLGTKGSVIQPQRAFNMQIQNRPNQRRPNNSSLPKTCSFYEKPCNNGQCILSYRVCDGFPDCADGSDEPLGCGRCFSGEFKCTNGRCISESLVCDGTDNCGDGTDEFFC